MKSTEISKIFKIQQTCGFSLKVYHFGHPPKRIPKNFFSGAGGNISLVFGIRNTCANAFIITTQFIMNDDNTTTG